MKGLWLMPALIAGGCTVPSDDAPSSEIELEHGDRGGHDGHDDDCSWSQWGQNDTHHGASCVRGQRLDDKLAEVTFDPFVAQESAETFGALVIHYQAPLNDSDGNVFMMQKSGTYISCDPPGNFNDPSCGVGSTQPGVTWNERAYRWHRDHLEPTWTFASDWRPIPGILFETMFQPALAGDWIYIPGAAGTVWKVDKRTGHAVHRINPFPTIDPNNYTTGGVTVDRDANVYWNVLIHDPVTFSDHGLLVKLQRDGRMRTFSYNNVPGAPGENDLCNYGYNFASTPPPFPWPSPDQAPPMLPCGSQRPSANMTPTIGRDGTVFTGSHGGSLAYSFIIALTPDLHPKWASSLRDRIADGCGVRIPYGPGDFDCREGTPLGFDPTYNTLPPLWLDDAASSSPVALPDGGVVMGALDNTTIGRGHLVKLDRNGTFMGTYDFGWDITPAVYEHDHTYSIILKDNHYDSSGPYYITQLSAALQPEWSYKNTSTESCTRNPDGTITCTDGSEEHPDGFEWCVNAPAVDKDGIVYALSEDGNIYTIAQGGVVRDKAFQEQSIGAAYTPVSLDGEGRIYALNNGTLRVLGDRHHHH